MAFGKNIFLGINWTQVVVVGRKWMLMVESGHPPSIENGRKWAGIGSKQATVTIDKELSGLASFGAGIRIAALSLCCMYRITRRDDAIK